MKALMKKLCVPVILGLMLLGGAAIPTSAQQRVQAGVTTVAYRPPHIYFGFGPPYPYYYPYGYPYGYWGGGYYHRRHWHRW